MSDEQHRRACWTRFCDAVDAAVLGDYAPAKRLIARPGVSASELRAFVRAVREGRVRKEAPYRYVNVAHAAKPEKAP